MLEHECSKQHGIGFCHNDLQYGNIMIDEDTNAITIIVSFSFVITIILRRKKKRDRNTRFSNRTTSTLVITQLHTT